MSEPEIKQRTDLKALNEHKSYVLQKIYTIGQDYFRKEFTHDQILIILGHISEAISELYNNIYALSETLHDYKDKVIDLKKNEINLELLTKGKVKSCHEKIQLIKRDLNDERLIDYANDIESFLLILLSRL